MHLQFCTPLSRGIEVCLSPVLPHEISEHKFTAADLAFFAHFLGGLSSWKMHG